MPHNFDDFKQAIEEKDRSAIRQHLSDLDNEFYTKDFTDEDWHHADALVDLANSALNN